MLVYGPSSKMSESYIHIPIYTNHLNLGFNKGTLLDDPHGLLQGSGKYIRHIPIKSISDYRNLKVITLIKQAIKYSINDIDLSNIDKSKTTISKIKHTK